ncbi:hypothetical protein LJR234_004399 [Mesorhizobium amorphae]
MSWHMMVEFTPPTIACVVSSGDFSFAALQIQSFPYGNCEGVG